jgi:hypothetical protein
MGVREADEGKPEGLAQKAGPLLQCREELPDGVSPTGIK